jgi:mannose/cellobiose epimerase-like protein (N-acyl-D-glucosamine 2-epimerase family)
MSDSDIFWTMATAAQYGGSFYQALGNAGLAADPNNKRRILAAFPEMVATYGTASRLHQTMRAGVAA